MSLSASAATLDGASPFQTNKSTCKRLPTGAIEVLSKRALGLVQLANCQWCPL
jgi:hypothetical protein